MSSVRTDDEIITVGRKECEGFLEGLEKAVLC